MKKLEQIDTHHLKNLLGFEIDSIEHVNDYNPMSKHRHDYWEIFIFNSGDGIHNIGFEEYPFKEHSIHFVQPFQIHTLNRNPESSGLVIMFESAYWNTSEMNKQLHGVLLEMNFGKLSPIMTLENHDFQHLWKVVKILKKDIIHQDLYSKVTFANFLNIIFCKCLRYFNARNNIPKNYALDLYQAFIGLLLQYNELHLESAVKKLFCSSKQLRDACLHCSGHTPKELIQDRRLQIAKQMLLFTEKSIGEIAHELHFSDIAHFSHFFKEKTGTLPSKYR